MKKTLFLAFLVVPLLFCACGFDNLTVPKEVEVRTDATYEFYLAKLDSKKQEWLDFSKFLDIGKMITNDEDGSSGSSENEFELFKYNSSKNQSEYQQLLMHMPLKDIDFDFGESFKNMDFAQNMQSMDLDKDIEIPDVGNLNDQKSLDLSSIKTALNTAVSFHDDTAASLNVGFTGFTTVEYESGSFDIITESPYTGTITLKDGDTYVTSAVVSGGYTASLDLSGKTIKNTGMKLEFTGAEGVEFWATVNSSSEIKKATGVNLDSSLFSIPDVDVSFPVNMDETIENCTITNGSMTVTIGSTEAPSWNSVISNYTIDVTGGISATVTKANPITPLSGTLTNNPINAHASVTVTLSGATVDFEHPPVVDVSVAVTEISATVKLPSDFKSSITENKDIGSDVTDYVRDITWNPSGFKITAKNTLPAGNNINLAVKCPFFDIDNTSLPDTIVAQGASATDQEFEFLSPASPKKITKFVDDAGVTGTYYDKIAVTATIGLPGGATDKITVVHVEPGKTYKVSIKVEPVMDWAMAHIALKDASNTSMKGQFDSNLNKAELFKTFGDSLANDFATNINFTTTPLYLFAAMPKSDKLTMFENAKYEGTIKAYFATKSGDTVTQVPNSQTEYLVGSASGPKVIPLVGMPALEKDSEGTVTTDFSSYEKTLDFSKALNLQAPSGVDGASLYLDYDIALSGGTGGAIEVTKDDIEELKAQGKSKISMDIVMIMTMKFDLTKDINMDILEMMDKDSESGSSSSSKTDAERDLFKRESATTMQDYQKYLDVVKSAELEFTKPKFPFITTGGMKLKVDWGKNEKTECVLKDDVNTVIAVNPSTLLDPARYPLEPTIEIEIGQGTFGLPREMEMRAGLKVRVKAKGDIQVYPFDESKEAN